MGIIIRHGKIWSKNQWFIGDLLIEKGMIQAIEQKLDNKNHLHQVIDAKGKIIIPGLIDIHVHLREPGFEQKETIETGTKAAAKGGFTTIFAMPNTNPVMDCPDLITFLKEKSKALGYVKVYPIGAITHKQEGKELANLLGMKKQGAVGFSDDGKGVQSTSLMIKAMETAKLLDMPIIAHVEDYHLAGKGVIHMGETAKQLQVQGIPSEAEYLQLERDLMLAESTGVHYHVCHVSSKESVQLIRNAKAKGVNVTAEVTPHHLLLTEKDIQPPYGHYKMNPPLRTEEDRLALIEGLIDGTIDVIATDHAPHTEDEKQRGLLDAPFGIVGLETAFPLLYTHLVMKKLVSLEQLIEWVTRKPAEIFGLQVGEIAVGLPADLAVIDLEQSKSVDPVTFASKGKNTPFTGWNLYGWPVMTIVEGKISWEQEVENRYA
ncbi:dihydroorotase [Tepidibacillus sp. HK-1]|uniref:dihydroorotase n=1 Tax=Tepidibacillus sp. HK-1 TaxID=1883407 RepID=UPI000853BBAF|nr:dihydroorotase [Tepidibacillus sp. HK-1]GBF11949.1 dihydroorotase [Tepidibacillus sp. HK-1]